MIETTVKKSANVIRDPAFAARLTQACDAHAHIPDKYAGRQSWVQRGLEKQFDLTVSPETVRKWFSGEAKPRATKMVKLAELLEVDEVWLSLGIDQDMTTRQRTVRNAQADGAVNVVAGLIQMDGGTVAFPDMDNAVAIENNVDMHAIIKGGKYDIHVTAGDVLESGELRFHPPVRREGVIVLGLIRAGFNFSIYEITDEAMSAASRRGITVEVTLEKTDSGLRKIDGFGNRL